MFWLKSMRQPVVRPLGGRLAQRARPGRLRLPTHVGLQRHVEVALPCESVQLPRVPHVEVVGQVPRLHFLPMLKVPWMQGGVKTPTCCPKRGLSQVLGCEKACSHLLVAPKKGLQVPGMPGGLPTCSPLGLPGFHLLAHPPQHAGEVRAVRVTISVPSLHRVFPVKFFTSFLRSRPGEAQPQVPVHVRALVLLGLHESNSCSSSATLGDLRLTLLSDKSVKLVLQTTLPVLPQSPGSRGSSGSWSGTAASRGSSSAPAPRR